jgi:hypothetical protein
MSNLSARVVSLKIASLSVAIGLLAGCALFKGVPSDVPFLPGKEFKGKHLTGVPLSDNWNEVELISYSPGHFTFPPPAGYKVLHYVDYVNNLSLDLYRELINDKNGFLDVIKHRRGSDHCDLYGEKFTTINGVDLIEVNGDCYIWHRGEFKRKYYFVRVGTVVFTFRLFSGVKDFEANQKEFDTFVDYAVNNYLIYPVEEEEITPYQHYAYPISREELVSFFQPAVEELKNIR